MKQFTVDENRRDTYAQGLASGNEPPMFTGLEGEWKQLVAVCIMRNFLYCVLHGRLELFSHVQDDRVKKKK